jgi:hypothetical protein
MTESKFRVLIALHIALSCAGAAAAFIFTGFSPELEAAYANEPEPWVFSTVWSLSTYIVLLVIPWIAGVVGLWRMKRWGRRWSLYSTVILLIAYPLAGASLLSGIESALFEAATLCWGAVLALAYYSGISERFE